MSAFEFSSLVNFETCKVLKSVSLLKFSSSFFNQSSIESLFAKSSLTLELSLCNLVMESASDSPLNLISWASHSLS